MTLNIGISLYANAPDVFMRPYYEIDEYSRLKLS